METRHLAVSSVFHNRLQMEGGDGYNYTYAEGNASTTTTTTNSNGADVNQMVVILLVGITIFVNIGLCLPSLINRRRRQRQWEAYRARRIVVHITASGGGETGSTTNLSPQEVQRNEAARYNSIENWIISKQIHAHDNLCSKCMMAAHNTTTTINLCSSSSKEDAPEKQRTSTAKTARTVDMTDEEWGGSLGDDCDEEEEDEGRHECPICFEEFQVGDVASWSPESTCTHIFHHACIKEWLLKNSGCPFCRATFLPVDRLLPVGGSGGGFQQMAELLQAQQEHKKSQQDCYYCIAHGIVTLPNVHNKCRGGCSCLLTQEEMEQATLRARDVPSKQVLVEMRGCGHPPNDAMIAKPPPLVTESSVTTSATTVTDDDDDDQRDIESSPDSSNGNSSDSSSSSTADAMSTRHLELNQGACEDDKDDDQISPEENSAHEQASESNDGDREATPTADNEDDSPL